MNRGAVPRLAARLITWRLPPDLSEPFLGDLEERFHEVAARQGRWAARRRCWREVLLACARRWPDPRPAAVRDRFDHGGTTMETLLADVRAGVRQLGKAPLFSFLVILTFALGIGTSSAIFSVVNPVLLERPPYPGADRITLLFERDREGRESHIGFATYKDLARNTSFASTAVMSFWQPVLEGEEPQVLTGQRVSSGFFRTLGVTPALGRDFTEEEDHDGAARVAIISHDLWQGAFAGDPAIIGRTVRLGNTPYQVIGVLPSSFESLLAPSARIWSPLRYELSQSWACRNCRHLRMIGRLKEGVSLAQASDEMQAISRRIVAANPTDYSGPGVLLTPLHEYLVRQARPLFLAVSGAVILLLLLACTNGANLLLGRAVDRSGEFAVRAALGAGRGSLVRRVTVESVVLALIGGVLGIGIAVLGVKLLVQLAPRNLPRIGHIHVDGEVLAFTVLVAVATGIAAGLAPALALARGDLAGLIRAGGRQVVRGEGSRLRRMFVTVGVSMALMLLIGAGLLLRSLDQLLAVQPGFDPRDLLTMELQATPDSDAAVLRYYGQVVEATRQIPGVQAAAVVNQLPLSGDFDSWGISFESRPVANPADAPDAFRYAVLPGYIQAMRIPLLAGRDLAPQDTHDSPPVALISATFAKRVLGDENPIGQRVKVGDPSGPWVTIVGVVGDIHQQSLDSEGEGQIYLSMYQTPWAYSRMMLVVRSPIASASLVPQVRQVLRQIDPGMPVSRVFGMNELLRTTVAPRRLALLVFEFFSVVALVLAGAGLYGVIAANVSQRTREIGIRAALGASSGRVMGLVLRQGMALAGMGLVLGLVGAGVLTRLLTSLLYGVSPTDPVTFLLVVAVLAAVALVACWAPARRALRVDPVRAMRE